MSDAMSETEIRRWLTDRVAATAGLQRVDPDRPLHEFGLSSRDAVALAAELGERLGRRLSPTLVWQNPTITALAARLSGGEEVDIPRPRVRRDEPIAIVGLGCRLPGGVNSPERFWRLLDDGADAIRELPEGRWADFAPREDWHDLPARGGFLDDVAGFDAAFFGITPVEAAAMDPQQRLLLEVTWQALEHAGIPPQELRGSRTGVFVGLSSTEYGSLTMSELDTVDAWTGTGAAAAIAANRLSYLLDLRGPSLTTDSACSSSLVAVHQAAASLRDGESDLAVVGGVNLMLSPGITANFHRAGVLSAEGRCAPFSASADGIVRGEGCGVVLLKRLSDARRDGDRVLSLVLGTATNSDGRSNGLVAPNPEAQRALLRDAYAAADLDPAVVDYVEAHGTGTPLGDPIEAEALGEVLGESRAERRPLLVGSVKSNLGHLEGAAGLVGLIKVVLAMRHGRIPASLHAAEPSPHIDFDAARLRIAGTGAAWPRYSGIARAGVSAFGFGGTNAHVVLEEWPEPEPEPEPDEAVPHVFALSARSESALRRRAADLADDLGETPLGDVAAALVTRRDHHPHRAAVVAGDREELAEKLRGLAGDGVHVGETAGTGLVFVFSGYGSQWKGMGGRLLETEPRFRSVVDDLEPMFAQETGFSLREVLRGDAEEPDLAARQQVLFAVQIALAATWRAHGVEPDAIVGHSMGEVAAAVVAGALPFADGLRVMVTRSRLLAGLDAGGAGRMAAVELSETEFAELAADHPDVSIAVHTSPTQCTVTGDAAQVEALVARVEARGRMARALDVGGAGHSAAVDPILDEFRARLGELTPAKPEIRCYSSVLDDPTRVPEFDEHYWAANLRRPVRFTQALAAAMADGHRTFLEISPHPLARFAVEGTAAAVGADRVTALPTLLRDADDQRSLLAAMAGLHVAGHETALRTRYPRGPVVDLPGPAWEHQRHWVRPRRRTTSGEHPVLGTHVEVPDADLHVWRGEVGTDAQPWLADHVVQGVPVLPATGYLDAALSAAAVAFGPDRPVRVRDLELRQPLPLAAGTTVHTSLRTTGDDTAQVAVHARSAAGRWVRHAVATVRAEHPGRPGPEPLGELTGGRPVEVYRELAELGQHYGPAFRGLRTARAGNDRASAGIALPAAAPRSRHHVLHPALADSCLHALAAAAAERVAEDPGLHLPMSLGSVRVFGDPAEGVRCDAVLDPADEHGDGLVGTVQLVDGSGRVLVEMAEVYLRRLRAPMPVPLADKTFELRWHRADCAPAERPRRRWLLLADGPAAPEVGRAAADLVEAGEEPVVLSTSDIGELGRWKAGCDGVVLVTGAPERYDEPGNARWLLRTAVEAANGLTAADGRLWLVTRDSVAVGDDPGAAGLAFLRGLVRVLAFEHPELRVTHLDLDSASPGALAAELAASAADDEVAWREGARFAARLERVEIPERPDVPVVRDGAYVLTGGLGGLGLLVARWLAERGATRIVLCGRSAPSGPASQVLDELRGRGTQVRVVLGDIAENGTAEELIREAGAGGVPVRGVLHAAGVLADATVSTLTEADVERVWRPKVDGARRLHEATAGLDLDWWLVFSSAAALLGSPGQTAYATANAWLDAFVRWRRGRGLPAATIQWGPWDELGGAVGRDNAVLRPLTPGEGLEALEAVLASGRAATGVTRLDAAATLELFPELARRPLFAALAEETDRTGAEGDGPDVEALRAAEPAQAHRAILAALVSRISGLTGLDPASFDTTAPLTRLGLDSLMAMRARTAFERDFGMTVPIPMLLRGASLEEVAAHVAAELGLQPVEIGGGRQVLEPREQVERWIAALWREVLDVEVLDVHDDFHALGGDEDRAERVHRRITERFPDAPGRAELFARPTIARMADLLRPWFDTAEPVLALRDRGERAPLFLFHPAGGSTGVYRPLVDLLPGDQPCYGFERFDDARSVEDSAGRYIGLLREIQGSGPYRLAGWSFGGCLAYEVARQLTELGEPVDLVAMIDSILPLPAPESQQQDLLLNRYGRFLDYVEQTYATSLGLGVEDLAGLPEDEQIRFVMDRIADRVPDMGEAVLHHQYTSYVDARIAERYRPRPYPGRVLLLRSSEPHPLTTSLDPRYLRTDESLGWDEFCSDLRIVRVPGDHVSMIDPPHVSVIADHLEGELACSIARPPRIG
ncbi:type I polyketide synthase [Saccharopolyspora flava]|uniref:Phthiocerol/phenolphthiocerol synthesis type-I polyketide synthase D n=1 Tax=Saccharopolyspora flava TaxID=95161 RepID=A0A1I6TLC6_9PSEU|nr:type I polyketide synthase [Saccharopolyspora flava]SFS90053.1 phthiocerol/phenolphthiocerol synthesis type-I polyketide synthase D [Saccharopolyspora flava]